MTGTKEDYIAYRLLKSTEIFDDAILLAIIKIPTNQELYYNFNVVRPQAGVGCL